jgi:hypothetical protein
MAITELERSLIRDFKKSELIDVAKELGFIKAVPEQKASEWVKAIMDDLYSNGVPDFSDCSNILAEFLVAAEIYDDQGNLLQEEEASEPEPKKSSKAIKPVVETNVEIMPECYRYYDENDPACKRCKLANQCKEDQKGILPKCFGNQYDPKAPECQVCIVAFMCSAVKSKSK